MSKDILILTTGGTIDKVYFDGNNHYQVGEPQIVEILRNINLAVPHHIETLFRKDSLDLTAKDRKHIAHRVQEAQQRRILITHGTDTMVQTAEQLQGIPHKTIVLVGSLTPARFKSTDAEFNIGFALAAVQTLPPGVHVAMNGRIFDPEHVRKNHQNNQFETIRNT